ncbi:SGNH/GDSL hydrolase family protein [Pedobacter sp. PWIIR3]
MDRRKLIKSVATTAMLSAMSKSRLFAMPTFAQNASIVFLFQGDSITDGNRGRTDWDLNHIMGHGYAFSIASRVGADFPERNLTFINKGISGQNVRDLADRWQKDTLDLKPDVLSILVGINDSDSYRADHKMGVSPDQYDKTYRQILNQVKAQNPNIIFVLGEPFTLPFYGAEGEANPRLEDVKLRQKIVKQIAADYSAVFVPYQEVFNRALKHAPEKYWIWDHVHPTVAGHELMTREWLRMTSKKISFLKKYS